MPPWDQPGVGRMAMVADPQGAPFYLMNPIPPDGQPDAASDVFSVDQPQHVRWNELSTSDPDGAIDFYKRQFGWDQEGDMPMGEMGEYRFVQHDGVGDRRGHADDARHARSHVALSTSASTTSTARPRRSTAGGGQVVNGPMEIPGGEYAVNGDRPAGRGIRARRPAQDLRRENDGRTS